MKEYDDDGKILMAMKRKLEIKEAKEKLEKLEKRRSRSSSNSSRKYNRLRRFSKTPVNKNTGEQL